MPASPGQTDAFPWHGILARAFSICCERAVKTFNSTRKGSQQREHSWSRNASFQKQWLRSLRSVPCCPNLMPLLACLHFLACIETQLCTLLADVRPRKVMMFTQLSSVCRIVSQAPQVFQSTLAPKRAPSNPGIVAGLSSCDKRSCYQGRGPD